MHCSVNLVYTYAPMQTFVLELLFLVLLLLRILVSGSISSVVGHDCFLCRYTTRVSKGHDGSYFIKQVILPYGKTLDIIGVNTGLLQVRSSCFVIFSAISIHH